MTRRLAAISVAIAIELSAGAARADEPAPMKPETRELLERGLELYRAREYEAAISEFERAFAIEERPELLFAMAQAERLSGDCGTAVLLYRRFLATGPQEMHAEAARLNIDKCERALASRPELAGQDVAADTPATATPEPPEDLLPPAPTRLPSAESASHRGAWYRDPLGASLLGLGAGGVGVGAALFAMSSADVSSARASERYAEYRELMDRAESRRTLAWVGLGAGSALLVGAAARYWLGDDDDALEVAVTASSGATGLSLGGRF
jgi:tetratricopeptide (TPR) repeat protein